MAARTIPPDPHRKQGILPAFSRRGRLADPGPQWPDSVPVSALFAMALYTPAPFAAMTQLPYSNKTWPSGWAFESGRARRRGGPGARGGVYAKGIDGRLQRLGRKGTATVAGDGGQAPRRGDSCAARRPIRRRSARLRRKPHKTPVLTFPASPAPSWRVCGQFHHASGLQASIMAKIPARSASGSFGQASISRAMSGSICDSRAKEWAKGIDGVSATCLPALSLRQGATRLRIW
jgi:hypothetical protein